jgi:hypothetical protein
LNKRLFTWQCLSTLLLFISTHLYSDEVLFVVPEIPPPASDELIRQKVTEIGHNVTTVVAGDATAEQAASFDLVLVSETISSGDVGDKFNDLAVPVVSMEPYIFDNLGMCGSEENVDYGRDETGQTQIDIVNSIHPLAVGLFGRIAVYIEPGSLSLGAPNENAIKIASLPDQPDRLAIFAYDSGAMMAGGFAAPARRVGLFLFGNQAGKVSRDGWKLFAAAINWAMQKDPYVSVEAEKPTVPAAITLYQNYPNPFNPTTTVSYSLPSPMQTTLVVYDLLGRQVALLIDELQPAGDYTIHFNGAGLPAGIYFYRLSAGRSSIMRKMTLLR